MGGIAVADLAIAVTKAGGLGRIGAVNDLKDFETQLEKANVALGRVNDLLPIGIGLLSFAMDIDETLAFIKRYRPAVVWLFAAHSLDDYKTWAERIRQVSSMSQIWVQIGSVAGAVSIVRDVRPGALCIQGIDAGGHGYEQGASIISSIPEILDALQSAGYGDCPLLAAGGIADGRAAAAALTLGAQGIVMGTRFLSAPETRVHPEYRAAILHAKNGGQATVRDKVFDRLKDPNVWPKLYDGRSLITASYEDLRNGVDIDDIRERHAEAVKTGERGFAVDHTQARAATWAGTGVGLVRREQPAADIVRDTRAEIIGALQAVKSKI